MKLLLFTSTFPRWENDNIPQFTLELAKSLSNIGVAVHVLAPHYDDAKTFEIKDNVVIHRFRYAPRWCEKLAYGGGMLPNIKKNPLLLLTVPLYFIFSAYKLIKLHKEYRFDVINPHWHFMQGWITCVARGVMQEKPAVLCTVHGSDAKVITTKPFNYISRLLNNGITCFSFVSSHLAKMYQQKKLIQSRYVIRSMGINNAFFEIPESPSSNKTGKLVFVGRLNKNKGVHLLLNAISQLVVNQNANIQLDVLGDGPELASLKTLAIDMNIQNRVNFYGWVDNNSLAQKLKHYQLAIFPSLIEEGFGLTALEALASHCNVVLPNFTSTYTNFGKYNNVAFFQPQSVDDLAAVISASLNNNEPPKKDNAIYEQFSWQAVAADYKQLIELILEKRNEP